MKLSLLAAALFAVTSLAHGPAFLPARNTPSQGNSATIGIGNGQITTTNSATTVAGIASNSMVQTSGSSYGGPIRVTIGTDQAWTGSAHFYYSSDGSALQQVPDTFIFNCQTYGYGAIASGATGSYQVWIPGGTAYFGASSLPTGQIHVTALVVGGNNPTPVSFSNGGTLLTALSGEASNTVTTTAAALTLSSSPAIVAPIFVLVTNDGSVDAYVSGVSGGHTWRIPAGVGPVYIPTGGHALYGILPTGSSGSTTLYCSLGGWN